MCSRQSEAAQIRLQYKGSQQHIPELWVRRLLGDVRLADGAALYLRSTLKKQLRRCVLHGLTVRGLVIPLLHRAERQPILAPLVPRLSRALRTYYLHLGRRDHKAKVDFDFSRVRV